MADEGNPQSPPQRTWTAPDGSIFPVVKVGPYELAPEMAKAADGSLFPIVFGKDRLDELKTARFVAVRNLPHLIYKKADGSSLMTFPETLDSRSKVFENVMIYETAQGLILDDGTVGAMTSAEAQAQASGQDPNAQPPAGAPMNQPPNFQPPIANGQAQGGFTPPAAGIAQPQGGFIPPGAAPASAAQAAQVPGDAAAPTRRGRRSAGAAVAPPPPPPPANPTPDQNTFAPPNTQTQGAPMNQIQPQNTTAGFNPAAANFGGQAFGGPGQTAPQQGYQGQVPAPGFQGQAAPQQGFQAAPAVGPQGFQGQPAGQQGFQAGYQAPATAPAVAAPAAQGASPEILAKLEALTSAVANLAKLVADSQVQVAELKSLNLQLLACSHHQYATNPALAPQLTGVQTLGEFQTYLGRYTGP